MDRMPKEHENACGLLELRLHISHIYKHISSEDFTGIHNEDNNQAKNVELLCTEFTKLTLHQLD